MIPKWMYEKICAYDSIAIFGHVSPDGDCYGSQLGLKEAILATFPGKKVWIQGSGVSSFCHAFAPMDERIDEKDYLAIIVDASGLDRVECPWFQEAKEIILVDHHIPEKTELEHTYVDTTSIAAAQIIAEFVRDYHLQISSLGASALLLGIITDSGRFRYEGVDARTFSLVSFLMEHGADYKQILDLLLPTSKERIHWKQDCYARMIWKDQYVYMIWKKEELHAAGKSSDEASGSVSLMERVKGYPIWLTFAQREDGRYRVELRSDRYNIQSIARKWGGGGHRLAAGISALNEEEIPLVLKDVECFLSRADMDFSKELHAAIEVGLEAGKEIMKIYHTPFEVEIKSDDSPVTLADKKADQMIREKLSQSFPTYAFLTEESEDHKERRKNPYCFIVDPVDGTKDFVKKDDQFTTNIALAFFGEVVMGVVLIPAMNCYYFAVKGHGTYKVEEGKEPVRIHVNDKQEDLTVLRSVFHFQDSEQKVIEKHQDRIRHIVPFGSSLKACKIAEGVAELSYRLSPGTKEWDTAASQIIVEEAGGVFVKPNGVRMHYNRENVYNLEGYVIANRKENILL